MNQREARRPHGSFARVMDPMAGRSWHSTNRAIEHPMVASRQQFKPGAVPVRCRLTPDGVA